VNSVIAAASLTNVELLSNLCFHKDKHELIFFAFNTLPGVQVKHMGTAGSERVVSI
jgi:hypothetical protein